MGLLHSSTEEFSEVSDLSSKPRYRYTARCSQTDMLWQLPCTGEVESIAKGLIQQLASDQPETGKLYGVLLAQTANGDRVVLKGFSGLLAGQSQVPGWVPPVSTQARMALAETHTLARLDWLKQELIRLSQLPVRVVHGQKVQQYAEQLQRLTVKHRQRKQGRDRNRSHYHNTLQGEALTKSLNGLKKESQQDSSERHRLKQERDQVLAPLAQSIAQADQQIRRLKQEYATLSRHWQAQMRSAYATQMSGEKAVLSGKNYSNINDSALERVCQRAAAKLLHYAATHALKPLAMAEFWWGQPQADYYPGQFYGASPEDCQTLMQLSQISVLPTGTAPSLPILYQDDAIVVVDKPAGLLSVPGRRYYLQDSVLSRLRHQLSDHDFLQVVHRLDQATSGILVLAISPDAHKVLGQQFAAHRVCKIYEAILSRPISSTAGVIKLPLWSNPGERPRQSVNTEHGRPSTTCFQVLQAGDNPRVQFIPHTGRTHQLRVHAAHRQGLNSPIVGDSLYGKPNQTDRLHLHAKALQLIHPITQRRLQFNSGVPF